MLRSQIQPTSSSYLGAASTNRPMADMYHDDDVDGDVDLDGGGDAPSSGGKQRSKSRRELPSGAVATLKAWLLSPEHFTHPYPTPQDQAMLMAKTGIDKKQLKNWFTNARRRIWKPMLKKQIEQGTLTAGGAPGIPGAMPGLMMPAIPGASAAAANGSLDNPHSIQAMRVHYQQAVQQQQQDSAAQQQQAAASGAYGNSVYTPAAAGADQQVAAGQFYVSQPAAAPGAATDVQPHIPSSGSIGQLPQLSSSNQLSKTDSHAVLMELFARDQDLVRQATESARLKAEVKKQHPGQPGGVATAAQQQQPGAAAAAAPSQHPMKAPSGLLQNVPTLNSWPHFSSITSLNNLGTMPGVKSITSLSGADLASKGNMNKKGNLAQVKSIESMGKNDSYAFLEVFFGDRASATNLSGMGGGQQGGQKGGKQGSGGGGDDQDNEIGLSLEDESPSQAVKKEYPAPSSAPGTQPAQAASGASSQQTENQDSGTLKRAYDDAMAARGLLSVRNSSERLTDLVLPAKIQRTLSQEFINKEKEQQQQQQQQQQAQPYTYSSTASAQESQGAPSASQQYPGQPTEPQASPSSSSAENGHVEVPTETRCAICHQTNVDTQLRPCGHMFHERCLKPSLQTPMGPPRCPVDQTPMQSALLAVPTEENANKPPPQQQSSQPAPAAQQQPSSWMYSSSRPMSTENIIMKQGRYQ